VRAMSSMSGLYRVFVEKCVGDEGAVMEQSDCWTWSKRTRPAAFIEWLNHNRCLALKSPAKIWQSALLVNKSKSWVVSVTLGGLYTADTSTSCILCGGIVRYIYRVPYWLVNVRVRVVGCCVCLRHGIWYYLPSFGLWVWGGCR